MKTRNTDKYQSQIPNNGPIYATCPGPRQDECYGGEKPCVVVQMIDKQNTNMTDEYLKFIRKYKLCKINHFALSGNRIAFTFRHENDAIAFKLAWA